MEQTKKLDLICFEASDRLVQRPGSPSWPARHDLRSVDDHPKEVRLMAL
jgi:hypothetical protein